jgi:uncharacterized protein YkwD
MKKLIFILLLIPSVAFTQDFYGRLNRVRIENNLPPLEVDKKLQRQSAKWLEHISQYPGLVHDTNVNEVLCENVEPLQAWLASKGHRRILLSKKFTKIGLAKNGNRYCARLK